MKYLTRFERVGAMNGYQKGYAEGFAIGFEEGRRLGLLGVIEIDLAAKFGVPGRKLLRKVKPIHDGTTLRRFWKFLRQANTIQEVREHLA